MMIRDSVAVFVFQIVLCWTIFIFIMIKSVSHKFVSYMAIYVPMLKQI